MFICGNGETIYWGSNEEVEPHPTMKQIEELGAYAVKGYHDEVVKPMLEELCEFRRLLRRYSYDGKDLGEIGDDVIQKKIQRLSMMIDNKPEWLLRNNMQREEENVNSVAK